MGHPDHGGCGRSVRSGQLQDLRRCAAQLPQRLRCAPRAPPPPSSPSWRAARRRPPPGHPPAHQPTQRRQRPGGHDVEALAPVQLLGPATDHPHAPRARARRSPRRGRWCAAAGARPGSPSGRVGRWPGPAPAAPPPSPDPRRSPRRQPATSDARQLSTCRSQSLGASRGPISPRSTPAVASSSTYRSARGNRSDENALRAASGVEGVSRETSVMESSLAITREGPPRTGAAPRPPTPRTTRRRPPRRARPSARTGSSGPAEPAPRSP